MKIVDTIWVDIEEDGNLRVGFILAENSQGEPVIHCGMGMTRNDAVDAFNIVDVGGEISREQVDVLALHLRDTVLNTEPDPKLVG